jgi:hypothetical protein
MKKPAHTKKRIQPQKWNFISWSLLSAGMAFPFSLPHILKKLPEIFLFAFAGDGTHVGVRTAETDQCIYTFAHLLLGYTSLLKA